MKKVKIRNELLSLENVGLAWRFHVSPDSCGNPSHYNDFIRLCALSEKTEGRSVTHILIDEEENRIAGYVALRVTSLISYDENNIPVANPALEISELAVDSDYERKHIGSKLIDAAIFYADDIRKKIAGIMYITVCADPAAVDFIKNGISQSERKFQIPRDGWNNECNPMYWRLPNI